MPVSLIHRDLGHRFADPAELERPAKWTGVWIKHRMIEAFTIEKRIPDKKIGPAIVRGAWQNIPTTDTFAERVDQGELAREHVWEQWARAGGALPYEISRMEEALSWPGLVLSNGYAVEGRVLLAWGFCVAMAPGAGAHAQARLVALVVLQIRRQRRGADRQLPQRARQAAATA